MAVIEFLVLLLIIAGSAILLSLGAEILAERYGANFTGSIVLGLITTLPEYMFVILAVIKGQYHMAVGSAVGACVILVTLGYGLVLIVATTRLSRKPVPVTRLPRTTMREASYLAGATIVGAALAGWALGAWGVLLTMCCGLLAVLATIRLTDRQVRVVELSRTTAIDAWYLGGTAIVALLLAWEGNGLDIKDGIILTLLFGGYMYQLARHAREFSKTVEKAPPRQQMVKAALFLLAGAVIIVLLTGRFVDSMLEIANLAGISPFAVALILSPLASEMPEKLTAYFTVHRDGKLAEISVCNFLGSKVNHNSLLLAMLPFVAYRWHGMTSVPDIITIPFILMTVITFFAVVNLARRRLTFKHGVMFATAYLLLFGAAYFVADPTMFPGH